MNCALRLVAAVGREPSVRQAPFSAGSLAEAARLEAPGGVYAVFSTWHGRRVVRLGHHLDRLRDSAHRLGIDSFELSADLLRREVCLVMDEAGIAEGKVRLSVHPDDPRSVLVAVESYPGPPEHEREHGVACMTRARSARDNPLAKQTDWLKTRDTFTTDGIYEWLLTDSQDRVLEGSSSNFYAIVDDPSGSALMQTAGGGVLSGIARSILLEIVSSEVPVSLVPVRTARLGSLREAFMTSSTRGVVPIVRIDGRDVGSGAPGPITRRLMHRYDERALELAEPLCGSSHGNSSDGVPRTSADTDTDSDTRDPAETLVRPSVVRDALSDLGIFVYDAQTGQVFPNRLWHDLGYTREQMAAERWMDAIHPDDRERTVAAYETILAIDSDEPYRFGYRVRASDGRWHVVISTGRVVSRDAAHAPRIMLGLVTDVTEQQQTEHALEQARAEAEQQAQEADALRMAGAIVASTLDVERTVQLVLDQALNVVPYDTATVELLRDDALEVIGGNGWDDLSAIIGLRIPYPGNNPHSTAIEHRAPTVYGDLTREFPAFSNIGGTTICSWLGIPLVVHDQVIGLLALDSTSIDCFTAKQTRLAAAFGDHVAVALHNARLYEQANELAMTDSLTGVSTRRSFFAMAETALRMAIRADTEYSVMMADLDRFKTINDRFGHAVGDEAIRRVVDAAQEILRRTDLIGRYGGDELAVVLPQTGAIGAFAIAERLRRRVAETRIPGLEGSLTVSIGVRSCRPSAGDQIDAILDQADLALFEAKRLGRNRVVVWDPSLTGRDGQIEFST